VSSEERSERYSSKSKDSNKRKKIAHENKNEESD
jgi:hypothetical protein